jgi:hypothetical protein
MHVVVSLVDLVHAVRAGDQLVEHELAVAEGMSFVAREALLTAWDRLWGWIEEGETMFAASGNCRRRPRDGSPPVGTTPTCYGGPRLADTLAWA